MTDGGAASKTVVNRFIRTKVNYIFFYVLHITLVRWLSLDDDKALKLTISTEVLNMTYALWRLLLVSTYRFCQFVLRENSLLLYQHSTCYLTEICGRGFAISVLKVNVPGKRRPFHLHRYHSGWSLLWGLFKQKIQLLSWTSRYIVQLQNRRVLQEVTPR